VAMQRGDSVTISWHGVPFRGIQKNILYRGNSQGIFCRGNAKHAYFAEGKCLFTLKKQ
jgi:hypothetical protein